MFILFNYGTKSQPLPHLFPVLCMTPIVGWGIEGHRSPPPSPLAFTHTPSVLIAAGTDLRCVLQVCYDTQH